MPQEGNAFWCRLWVSFSSSLTPGKLMEEVPSQRSPHEVPTSDLAFSNCRIRLWQKLTALTKKHIYEIDLENETNSCVDLLKTPSAIDSL